MLLGCEDKSEKNEIKFAICADYPPFEYFENGKIVGYDIDLAKAIAQKLSKDVVFEDTQLAAMLAAVQSGNVDAAISALAATEERKKNCDFTVEYYREKFALVYKQDNKMATQQWLARSKIACQLGSTMEAWLKENIPNAARIIMDNNNQAIEALKTDHVDCILMDEIQASNFCKKNRGLKCMSIATSGNGYAIVLKKGSNLKEKMNNALKELEASGKIEELKKKWLTE
jgi:polar amino acid transport system substrate-binding protein